MESLLVVLGALVGALVFAAIVLGDRRRIFALALGSTLVPCAYVERYYFDLPTALKWLPELALVGAGCAALVLCPRTPLRAAPVLVGLSALSAAASAVSAQLGHTSPSGFLLAQRGLVLFWSAFLALRSIDGIHGRERVYGFLVDAGMLSGAVSFLQRLTVARSEPDRVTGLFSLGEVVLFFHLVVLILVLSSWVEGKRLGRFPTPLVVAWIVLSLAVGNQEASVPYLGLVFAFFLVRARARRLALLGTVLAVTVPAAVLFTTLYDASYRGEDKGSFASTIFDRAYLQRYVFGEGEDVLTPSGDLLRGAAIVTAHGEIAGTARTRLLGHGPGAASESGLAGGGGPLALAFPGIGRVTLSLLLAEGGYLGLLLHLVLLAAVLFVPRARRRAPEERAERLVREAVVLLALGFLFYTRLLYEPIFALLLAVLVHPLDSPGSQLRPSAP